ncbi:MAG: glycosyltransferase family 1 protein, partial [Cyanobacteria bacterium J06598_3]
MSSHPIRTLAFLFTTFPPEVTGSAYYNWERVKWLAAQGNYRVVVLAPDWQGKMPLPAVPAELSARLTV